MIDGVTVIDFHSHTGRMDNLYMRDDPELMLRAMDAAGVDIACVNNCFCPDGTLSNDINARFVAQHPDRFIGIAYVSPLMPQRMVPELTRAIDKLGFKGIKVYSPSARIRLSEPAWYPIYEFADQRGLSMLFHTDVEPYSQPRFLADVAPRFPRAIFVAGHSGNTPEGRAEVIAAAQACPNVYAETCSTFRTPGAIEELVAGCGADRVLYGSDQPLMDPRAQIGKIITANLPDDAKRLILGGNACRLLKM